MSISTEPSWASRRRFESHLLADRCRSTSRVLHRAAEWGALNIGGSGSIKVNGQILWP